MNRGVISPEHPALVSAPGRQLTGTLAERGGCSLLRYPRIGAATAPFVMLFIGASTLRSPNFAPRAEAALREVCCAPSV
jgi:hypothetical protein